MDIRRQTSDVRPCRAGWLIASLLVVAPLLVGCRQDMHDQPRYDAYEESDFFADGMTSRLPIERTVARGQLNADSVFYQGLTAEGELVEVLPIELDEARLARGQVLFNAYCSPCHDRTGGGNGSIVRRGLKRPESFHTTRLKESPPGYYFQVMTNGFGEMSSYAGQVTPDERWMIAAYVQALQFSQAVPADLLNADDRDRLAGNAPPAQPEAESEDTH